MKGHNRDEIGKHNSDGWAGGQTCSAVTEKVTAEDRDGGGVEDSG